MTLLCPKCHNPHVIRMSSLRIIHCGDCGTESPWPLKDGQKPLISCNRSDRKHEQAKD
jgi:ribosomal protein L37AE/L43A